MSTERETTTINISGFPLGLWREVRAEAARNGKTAKTFVVEALAGQLEDLQDALEAEEAYQEFLKRGEKGTPLADVEKELGL